MQSEPSTTNQLGQPIGQAVPGWVPPRFPEHQPMEGRLCRLDPLEPPLHGKALHAAFACDVEGRGWTYLPYGPFSTSEEFNRWVGSLAAAEDPQFYTVILKNTEAPVGLASFLRINPGSGTIEVGHIHFSDRIKRSPAATEAMFLMMRRVFDLGYRRCEWKCDALNAASCSAAERLGFSFEGVFRQATVYKGRNRDTAWFAAVDSDWPKLKVAFLHWLDPSNFDENGRQLASLRALTRPMLKNPRRPQNATGE